MRKLFKLAVFLLLVHAFYRFGPVYWNDASLRWEIKESAKAWQGLNQAQVEEEILALAERHNVPILRQHLAVRSTGTRVSVDLAYVVPIEFLPGWKYPWTFENTVDTWTLNRSVRVP